MQRLHHFFHADWVLAVLLQLSLCVLDAGSSAANGADTSASGTPAPAKVRSITLPHFEPELPLAPGKDDYLTVCVSCHSPRYVVMQPPFPQRQWE